MRPIDADHLKERLPTFAEVIDEEPTLDGADIEPEYAKLTHGHWMACNRDNRGYAEKFMCSYCKQWTHVPILEKECDYDFCPNCGAVMDEETEVRLDHSRNCMTHYKITMTKAGCPKQ